ELPMSVTLSSDLADQVRRQCNENAFLCYQCQKCSSGCPVAEHFDLAPNQLMRAVQLGQKETVLKSRTLWLCAMCETCAVRCPHDINITKIMDVLKIMAQKEGLSSPLPPAVLFNQAAMRGIGLFGRMYEAGLMGEIYLRQLLAGTLNVRQLVKRDLPLAMHMIKKGKLKLLPSFGKPTIPVKTAEKREGIAYYPGCSLHGTSSEYNTSVKAVLSRLDVTLVEPENWNCCGSTPAHSTDRYLSLLLPLKDLLLMEKAGFDNITTPCPSCFIRLRTAQKESGEHDVKEKLLTNLKELPSSDLKVDHLLQTITERIGFNKVAEKAVRSLKGMKLVCYYGCIITRPPKITAVQDYEYPTGMDRLMKTLGATPLDWSYKTRCCGATLSISQPAIALNLTKKILQDAKNVGAEAIVVACPLCHINLDARQQQISEELGEPFHLPILYFTQLMGLAFGMNARELGLDKHFVETETIVNKIN
ncbi:MAG: heterodisulfide reductase-related iron-sulfur binding cluster, partial [Syntrophales bacterium]|nr:heterodisulfide reductase-related iron-sulfur binding cluster [Syntrophales bacterium]